MLNDENKNEKGDMSLCGWCFPCKRRSSKWDLLLNWSDWFVVRKALSVSSHRTFEEEIFSFVHRRERVDCNFAFHSCWCDVLLLIEKQRTIVRHWNLFVCQTCSMWKCSRKERSLFCRFTLDKILSFSRKWLNTCCEKNEDEKVLW